MAIDLTGGIDPAREYVFAERPHNPEMRDSVCFWVFDDRGEVGLTRIGIEALVASWDAHSVQINVAFPDGRVSRPREDAVSWPADSHEGTATVPGAGPLSVTCVEPLDVWTMTFDGQAVRRARCRSALTTSIEDDLMGGPCLLAAVRGHRCGAG